MKTPVSDNFVKDKDKYYWYDGLYISLVFLSLVVGNAMISFYFGNHYFGLLNVTVIIALYTVSILLAKVVCNLKYLGELLSKNKKEVSQ